MVPPCAAAAPAGRPAGPRRSPDSQSERGCPAESVKEPAGGGPDRRGRGRRLAGGQRGLAG
eukprot:10667383-Prorocentrum_lima.AAC.1